MNKTADSDNQQTNHREIRNSVYSVLFTVTLGALLLLTIVLFVTMTTTGAYPDSNSGELITPKSGEERFKFAILMLQTIFTIMGSATGLIIVNDQQARIDLKAYILRKFTSFTKKQS